MVVLAFLTDPSVLTRILDHATTRSSRIQSHPQPRSRGRWHPDSLLRYSPWRP